MTDATPGFDASGAIGNGLNQKRDASGLGPILDDANVQKCICTLWRLGGYGFRQTEAGMDIVRSQDGSLSCRFWPFSNLYHRAETPRNWPMADVAAAVHTHPRKQAVQYPSYPADYIDKVDDYVVCADAIFSVEKGCTDEKQSYEPQH